MSRGLEAHTDGLGHRRRGHVMSGWRPRMAGTLSRGGKERKGINRKPQLPVSGTPEGATKARIQDQREAARRARRTASA